VPAERGDVRTVDDDQVDIDEQVDVDDEVEAEDEPVAHDPEDHLFDQDQEDAVQVDDEPVVHDPEDHLFDQDQEDAAGATVVEDEDDVEPTGEHTDLVPPAVPDARPTRRQHRAEMKRSARRVRRVVRHVDAWSVFKVASIFVACVWGVVVLASLLIWRAAESSGSVENTEEFVKDIGFKDFDFDPQQMFDALLSAGAVLAVAAIFFIVLLTVLFNLICDMTGGLRITMIEQDVADARKRRRSDADEPAS